MNQPLATPRSRRHLLATGATLAALTLGVAAFAHVEAQTPATTADAASTPTTIMGKPLRKYNVTVRRFNPTQGPGSGDQFVLPVDSPDPEHAISAAMSNAVAFTTKSTGTSVLPVAFLCTGIADRTQ